MATAIDQLRTDMDTKLRELARDVAERYVTKDAFTPIQRAVYGVMILLLSGVLTALLALVLKK